MAPLSGFRRHRGHPLDQAADPVPPRHSRPRRAGPQPEAGARRHSRDRVLRADPAAHRRRPRRAAARPDHAGRPPKRFAEAGWIEPRETADGVEGNLPVLTRRRAPASDDRRPADPFPAGRRGRPGRVRGLLRLRRPGRFHDGNARASDPHGGALRRAVRRRAGTRLRCGQPRLYRRRPRPRHDRDARPSRLRATGRHDRDRQGLALRPRAGPALGLRARAADRAGAAASSELCRARRSRRRASCPSIHSFRRPARRRPALRPARREPAADGAVARRAGRRPTHGRA